MRAHRTLLFGVVFTSGFATAAAAAPIAVGNFVWDDVNANGIQEAGEPGVPNVVVQLWNEARDALLDQDTSDANGSYQLTAPDAGSYRVRVVLPAPGIQISPINQGASDALDSDVRPDGPTFGFTDTVVLASNVTSIGSIDIGLLLPRPVDIGSFVWEDYDEDGIQDVAEPGMPGVTVQLWNDARNELLAQTTTTPQGQYQLTAPTPGSCRVRVVLPELGDGFSPKDQGANDAADSDINQSGMTFGFTDTLVLPFGQTTITTIDAGITRAFPVGVGDFVWDDVDGDGLQDAGERGLAGITVQLWNSTMNQVLDQDMTSSGGAYAVLAPDAGSYRLRVLLPSLAFGFAPKDQGVDDRRDSDIDPSGPTSGFSDPFSLVRGQLARATVDAGLTGATVFRNGFE